MAEQPELPVELHEALVAYLDGELSDGDAAELERQLDADPLLQKAMRELEESWKLLDDLTPASPEQPSTNAFTQATLTRAIDSIRQTSPSSNSAGSPWSRAARRLVVLLAAFAAGIASYGATATWLGHSQTELLRNLPLIAQVDRYRNLDDLEHLRTLAELFSAANHVGDSLGTEFALEQATLDERRAWMHSLDRQALHQMQAKSQRYFALSSPQQRQLKSLHAAIQSAPDQESLQHAMLMYTQWLGSLTSVQRAALLSMGREERLAAITTALEEAERTLVAGTPLERADLERLRTWSRDFIAENHERLMRRLPAEARRSWSRVAPSRQRLMLLNVLLRRFRPLGPVSDDELAQLTASLTPKAQAALSAAKGQDRELLAQWLQRANMPRIPSWARTPSPAKLEAFYRTLSLGRRRYLDQLPPAQSRDALLTLYFLQRRTERRLGAPASPSARPPASASRSSQPMP